MERTKEGIKVTKVWWFGVILYYLTYHEMNQQLGPDAKTH